LWNIDAIGGVFFYLCFMKEWKVRISKVDGIVARHFVIDEVVALKQGL
jgi:hypothetical protein